jgi:hypothetical protein
MSKAERALEAIIGVGIGVATCVMSAQGAWKKVRRRVRRAFR